MNSTVIAEEEALDSNLMPEVKYMLEEVKESQIWRRALAAKTMLQELPFRTMIGAGSYEGNTSNGHAHGNQADIESNGKAPDLLLKGVVDFLFEEEDGWVIVDFKTDMYADGQLGLFSDFYRPQVQAYASELERAFGLKVKEQGLYFLHGNEYVVL